MYVDVEALIAEWLRTKLEPDVTVRTELPEVVNNLIPLVCVERFGGADRVPTIDQPMVDIDVFAVGNNAAKQLAEQVRELLRNHLPGYTTTSGTILGVTTILGPTRREWDDTGTRRRGATYEIITKS
jgi:hypothetical protein